MKNLIFVIIIVLFLCSANVFAIDTSSFPDSKSIQPFPPDILPDVSSNIDRDEDNINNPIPPEDNETNPEIIPPDEDTGYTDTSNRRLFVLEPENNRVLIFNLKSDDTLIDDIPDYVLGQLDFVTFTSGTTDAKFNNPQAITYDPEDDLLFVSDTGNNRIMVFDVSSITNGESAINIFGQPTPLDNDPGSTESEFNAPTDIVYDPDSNQLFVSDTGNNRIMVFDVSSITNGESAINVLGQETFSETDPGSSGSELSSPAGLIYDSNSNQLFVSDTGNNRIMVFDVSSITNGESAVKTIEHAQNLESIKSSLANDSRNKSKSNLFWVIILSLLVLTVLIFLIIKIIRPGK